MTVPLWRPSGCAHIGTLKWEFAGVLRIRLCSRRLQKFRVDSLPSQVGIHANQTEETSRKEVTAMSNQIQKPREAYMLSILSGIAILIGGVFWIALTASGWAQGWFGWFGGYMHGFEDHMYLWYSGSFGYLIGLVGLVSGVSIILASNMLNSRPNEHGVWGLVIIIFSITGMMAGMVIGFLLGIIGGILAILWQPPTPVAAGAVQQA